MRHNISLHLWNEIPLKAFNASIFLKYTSMDTRAKHGLEFHILEGENIVMYQLLVKVQHWINEQRLDNK